jgi:hypothetical protein
MKTTDAAMDPLRSAALTLHALPAPDREWLLEGLSGRQRQLLLPLLEELQVLGVPADPELLQELQPDAGSGTPAPAWPEALSAAEVAVLAHVLAGEPLGLTRSLLAIREWNWTPQLLAAMDEDRRRKLRDDPPACPPAPLLQAAILQALRLRCESQPPVVPAAATSRWHRARGVLRWKGRA